MNDRTPTGTPPETDRPPDRTRPRSVAEAAAALGVTPDAIRARLQRGTLAGEKVDGVWQVYLLADTDRQDATGTSTARQDTDRTRQDRDRQAVTAPAPVDLAPLVDELHDLRVELQRVTEAATVWQLRAVQAEHQLQQLTAGTVEPASAAVPPETAPAEHARTALEPQSAPSAPPALWQRLRRWLGGT